MYERGTKTRCPWVFKYVFQAKWGDQWIRLWIATSRVYNGIGVNKAGDSRALTIVINQLPLKEKRADIARSRHQARKPVRGVANMLRGDESSHLRRSSGKVASLHRIRGEASSK